MRLSIVLWNNSDRFFTPSESMTTERTRPALSDTILPISSHLSTFSPLMEIILSPALIPALAAELSSSTEPATGMSLKV